MDVVIVVVGEKTVEPTRLEESPFARLPKRVSLADTIATQDAPPHSYTDIPGDPERDFMLRYSA
jgi:hypothetical protein